MNESPIFARVKICCAGCCPPRKFPREYRFTLAQEVTRHGFALQEALVAAGLDRRQAPAHLLRADMALTNLRKLLLLCYELELLSAGQFRHVSQMTAEVGRLLGGWRKSAGER